MSGNDRNENSSKNAIVELYDWVETFMLALASVIIIFTLLFKFVTVDGESMLQTLHNADRLIITDIFYKPQTGDIVVLDVSNKAQADSVYSELVSEPLIKRVIATGGQTVDINPETWEVLVDGAALDETYVNYENITMRLYDVQFPLTVEEGYVFVMGDNRNHSADSRYSIIGQVDQRYILGRVILRLFPLSSIGKVK